MYGNELILFNRRDADNYSDILFQFLLWLPYLFIGPDVIKHIDKR